MSSAFNDIFKNVVWVRIAASLVWILALADALFAPGSFLNCNIHPCWFGFNIAFVCLISASILFASCSPGEIVATLSKERPTYQAILGFFYVLCMIPYVLAWGVVYMMVQAICLPFIVIAYLVKAINPSCHEGKYLPIDNSVIQNILADYKYIRLVECTETGCYMDPDIWYGFFPLGECIEIRDAKLDNLGHRILLRKLPGAKNTYHKEACLVFYKETVFGSRTKAVFADVIVNREWSLFDNPYARREGVSDYGFLSRIELPYIWIGSARFELLESCGANKKSDYET